MLPLARPRAIALRAVAVVLLALLVAAPPPVPPANDSRPVQFGDPLAVVAPAAVSWAPSSLLVSEVVTGGSSASDEFVEIYNAGSAAVELAGLELVYATASGGTVTRKQAWSELVLHPGRRLLLANAAGAWAATADGLYTGGFAATGGSLALRVIGGAVIDTLSWGDASNSFVESRPGPAPAAGASLERLPGGPAGNGVDTNDNLLDTRLEQAPVAHNMAAPPAPAPVASPLPATPMPSPMPEPSLALDPTLAPDPTPWIEPTLRPDPTAQPEPSLAPDPPPPTAPPPTAPPPTAPPTASPLPSPSATAPPTPSATPPPARPHISDVRLLPLGTSVTVAGTLTTPLGLTESGKGAFVQDATAGIALYLAAGDWPALPAGSSVQASGVLETRFSLLTLRLPSAAALTAGEEGVPPAPALRATGQVAEDVEGQLVTVVGLVTESPNALTDGYSTAIDDGSGTLRVVVATATGIGATTLGRGSRVELTGVVGQRDTSGTGLGGYRLHLRSQVDVTALPEPLPSPSASAAPAPTSGAGATPAPTPTPAPQPTPSQQPSPSPAPVVPTAIATARSLEVGIQVTVRGVVTVAPGRILGEATIAIQDSTAGICVRLPSEQIPGLVPGRVLEVSGPLAAPFGNLELRPASGGARIVGTQAQPAPRDMAVGEMGEATEGLLARITGTIRRVDASATSMTVIVVDDSGEGRVFVHRPVGLERSHFSVGQRIEVTGIVGDRSGLYRLWPRDPSDVRRLADAAPSPPPSSSATPRPTAGGNSRPEQAPSASGGASTTRPISIADALRRDGQTLTVEGSVTAAPGLLDADGRRLTVEDQSAAVLVRLPAGAAAPAIGQRLRVTGKMGTYFGAPQLAADEPPDRTGSATLAAAQINRLPLAATMEWRLVTLSGDVVSVHRDGEAWRAEVALAGGSVPIVGLARSGIPSDALVTGRRATIRGLVKRAHPTARDQRFGIVPRSTADIALGGAATASKASTAGSNSGGPATGEATADGAGDEGGPQPSGRVTGAAAGEPATNAALADIAAHAGRSVRVGGRVAQIDGPRFVLRDGTSTARVRLSEAALSAAASLRVNALVNATGEVVRQPDGGVEVVVSDPTDLHVLVPLAPVSSAAPSPRPVDPVGQAARATESLRPTASSASDQFVLAAALLALIGLGIGAESVRRGRRLLAERRSTATVARRLAELPPP